jgi:hypothetical protein
LMVGRLFVESDVMKGSFEPIHIDVTDDRTDG